MQPYGSTRKSFPNESTTFLLTFIFNSFFLFQLFRLSISNMRQFSFELRREADKKSFLFSAASQCDFTVISLCFKSLIIIFLYIIIVLSRTFWFYLCLETGCLYFSENKNNFYIFQSVYSRNG